MKRILVLCCLYSFALLSYANTCPQPPRGYVFRVAAWGNHYATTSQIRCHYYPRGGGSNHQEILADGFYHEAHMKELANWSPIGDLYYVCTSYNTNVNECTF